MTKLLQRLHDELVRRHYAATTIRSYVQIVEAFRRHTRWAPRSARPRPSSGATTCTSSRSGGSAVGTVVAQICALRFFCRSAEAARRARGPAVSEAAAPLCRSSSAPRRCSA